MKLIKGLNNNTALVVENTEEYIVMGKGIAFNKKIGETINTSLIEKKYTLQKEKSKNFDKLIQRIHVDILELASKIIDLGEKELGYKCSDLLLFSLADHLNLVVERAKENLYFATPLEWDIKLIYPNEFRFSKKVVKYINETKNLNIPEQEASFIALHFINSNTNNNNMNETILTTKIIQNILNIVKIYFGRDIDENDYDVSRFIVHIRYFVHRQINGDIINTDTNILDIVSKKYKEDYKCALKISEFLENQYNWNIHKSEKIYLTLHLNRMNSNK